VLHAAMNAKAEALLMFAARAEHVASVIEPALAAGRWVVCDRFSDATYAYQCGGRGLPRDFVVGLERLVHPGLQPDATFLFDVDPTVAFERQRAQSRAPDRFESEKAGFFVRVRESYLERAREHSRALPCARCLRRDPAGARPDRGRLRPGLSMSAFPWHRGELSRLLADRGRMPHALLVHGRAGIGKVEFARALAESVLCEAPREGLACGVCASCHWFSQGNHPDFREIVPESALEDDEGEEAPAKAEKAKSLVIKIEQIRAIADFIALTTHRAGYRVLLIHPAEALHPAAANALSQDARGAAREYAHRPGKRPARAAPRDHSQPLPPAAPHAPPRKEALEWLRGEGVAAPEVALAGAGGAPLLARDLAEPPEAELRKARPAELARPGGADPVQFASGMEKANVERLIYWMQTWVHDLLRVRLAGEARHHGDLAPALKARAQAADVEGLFALERELAAARRLASHPLNPRAGGRAFVDGLQSGHCGHQTMSEVAAEPVASRPGVFTLTIRSKAALYDPRGYLCCAGAESFCPAAGPMRGRGGADPPVAAG